MSRQSVSKSSLFLMEMVIVIFFFSLCAAVCVHLFSTARQTSDASYELSCAVMAAQNAAECYKNTAGDLPQTAELLDGTQNEKNVVVIYDRHWQRLSVVDGEQAVYQATLTALTANTAEITMQKIIAETNTMEDSTTVEAEPIYILPVQTHGGGAVDA